MAVSGYYMNERDRTEIDKDFGAEPELKSDVFTLEMEKKWLKGEIKNTFSKVGWGFFSFLIVGLFSQFVVGAIYGGLVKEQIENKLLDDFLNYSISLLPMYVIGIHVLLSYLKKIPTDRVEGEKIGFLRMLKFFFISLPIMYLGNMMSLGIMYLVEDLTGKTAVSNISEMIESSNPLMLILFVVIIGPAIEEIIFRKLLIDRTVKYGEKNAVILSAVMFGLFHMNLFQFFYATALGVIFGYMYVRSRKLRYTIILHMIINFMGSVVAVLLGGGEENGVLRLIQEGKMEEIPTDQFLQLVLFGAYSIFLVIASIVGIVLIILNIRKIKFRENDLPLEKGELRSLTYGNLGISFFFGLCIVMTLITTIMQLQ